MRPRSGRIVVEGEDCTRLSTERRAARGLGYVPQEHAVFSGLSVRENLAIGALAIVFRERSTRALPCFRSWPTGSTRSPAR